MYVQRIVLLVAPPPSLPIPSPALVVGGAGDRGNYGGDALDKGIIDVEDVAFDVVQTRQGGQLVVKASSFPLHPLEHTMCQSSSQCPSTRAHRAPPIARLVSPLARSSPPDPSVRGERVQDYLTGAQDRPHRRRMQVEGGGAGGREFGIVATLLHCCSDVVMRKQ